MLSNLTLHNFKSFRQLDNLKIKPITILCGANSCGKSSILQSLLLLKQTKESRSSSQALLLNGKYVHLGDIENIIHGKDKGKITSCTYEYEFTKKNLYQSKRKDRNRPPIAHMLRYILSRAERGIKDCSYRLTYTFKAKISKESKGYIKVADIDTFKVSVSIIRGDGEVQKGGSVEVLHNGSNCKLKWNNVPDSHVVRERNGEQEEMFSGEADGLLIRFENLFPIIEHNDAADYEKLSYQVRNFLRVFDDFLLYINEGVTYIGPLREEPSRRYIYENEVLEIGSKGENAAYIYQTEQDTVLKNHFFYDEKSDEFVQVKENTLNESLKLWLEQMNIKGFSPDHQSEIIRLNMDANSSHGTRVNIADVGFGVSQIFPILMEGLRMKKNGSLLLEQPEIHLHPALQMQMADYFLSLALSEKNVLVETHSEHIINRLVRRIVEDESNKLNDMIAIYFVSNSDNGATFEEVKLDPLKGIANWPVGFFDQTASEQERIMLAGIKKRKAIREKNK
jgi:predicted ATPase